MQSFLPYQNFRLSAHVLDARRLGKQRLEAMQILRLLAGRDGSGSWKYHPAVRMWRDYGPALSLYMHCVIQEWEQRGYVSNLPSPRTALGAEMYQIPKSWSRGHVDMPPWIGHERFHASHRAALLHKDPDWYAQFCWDETPVLDYFWPGRWPDPGDAVVAPDGRTGVVMRLGKGHAYVRLDGESQDVSVSRRDFALRVWQAATRR